MTTKSLLLSAWDPSLAVGLLCALALAGYGVHFRRRLEMRGLFFVLAVAVFFLALASPIGVLARGYLFSAHMLQHLLLMLAVPPLVLLGMPRERSLRAPPPPERGALGYALPWFAGVGAMWIWHAPTLCNLAAASPAVQAFQTASLLAMGLAFWRPILAPRLAERMPAFSAILYLFAACVACTILGIMVTLSPVEVCSAYMHPVDTLGALPLLRDGWGMSCHADQEIGGLMMWVPACLVYAAAILATLGRYYGEERASHEAPQSMGGAQ
jgi:cytochrome c oxidase assembly factor CtaG